MKGGETLRADIVFAAFGRVANLDGIGLERLELAHHRARSVEVDESFETNIPGHLCRRRCDRTAGACLRRGRSGAPRRARRLRPAAAGRHESGADRRLHDSGNRLRRAVAEPRRRRKSIDVIVGRADFREVARAHIVGEPAGFLTLICERGTARVLGVRCSARAPPNSCISARPRSRPARPPSSSSNRSSIFPP